MESNQLCGHVQTAGVVIYAARYQMAHRLVPVRGPGVGRPLLDYLILFKKEVETSHIQA